MFYLPILRRQLPPIDFLFEHFTACGILGEIIHGFFQPPPQAKPRNPREKPGFKPMESDRESVCSMLFHTWVAALQSQFGLAMMALAFWGLALVENLGTSEGILEPLS